jgi:hypothetical protein
MLWSCAGDLLLPRRGSCKEQVRHVQTRNEQHEPLLVRRKHVTMEIKLLREVAIDSTANEQVSKLVAKPRPHHFTPPA